MRSAHITSGTTTGGLIAIASIIVAGAWFVGPIAVVVVLAIGVVILLAIAARQRPEVALALWLVVLLAVPPWIYATVGGVRIAPAAVLSIAIIIGRLGTWKEPRRSADWAVAALGLLLVLGTLFGSPSYLMVQGLGEWILCFIAGRLLIFESAHHVTRVFAGVGTVLALLAALQYVTQYDVSSFVGLLPGADSGSQWMALQFRNGAVRAEVSLGHSISAGGVLAMCLPFAAKLANPFTRFASVALIIVGVLATQSRAALLASALALAVALFFYHRLSVSSRVLLAVPVVIAVVAVLPQFISDFVFGSGDSSSEVNQGTRYRVDLLSTLGNVRPVGLAANATPTGEGTYFWGNLYSIDNGLLYIALYIGGLAAIAYALPLLSFAKEALNSKWTPTALAVVSQLPLLLTVAPITQHQSVYWLLVGIATTAILPLKDRSRSVSVRRPYAQPSAPTQRFRRNTYPWS